MNALFCCIVILCLAKTTKSACSAVCLSEEIPKIKDGIHEVEKVLRIGTEDLKNGTRDFIGTQSKITDKINYVIEKQNDAQEQITDLKNDMIAKLNDAQKQITDLKNDVIAKQNESQKK